MTGRQHAPPDQLQQLTRLACPFAKSDPDTYRSIPACRTTEGFKELGDLNEHIWRKHTAFYRCGFCSIRWSISTPRGKVTQKKEEHWEKTCEGKRHGARYFVERFDEDGTELLIGEQQERFTGIKTIRGNDRKLKALYEACNKRVPDDYSAPVALPPVQPQVTYRTVTRTTTTRRVQQPDSHRGDLFNGFVQPRPEGHHRQPRRRTTAHNVSRSDAQATRGDYEISGANRQPDTDSGYVSMPRNDGDASDVSPADGFPSHQPGGTYQWSYASSHARSYEGVGNDVASTTGSGHLSNNGEDFGQVYHECFGFGFIDPSLCSTAGPSNRGDGGSQALLGLALPCPRGDAEEPVNPWALANFNAEFPE